MKRLLIVTTLSFGLLTACTNNADKEAGAVSETQNEQMEMSSSDSTADKAFADSVKAASDNAAQDSADAAHGHSH